SGLPVQSGRTPGAVRRPSIPWMRPRDYGYTGNCYSLRGPWYNAAHPLTAEGTTMSAIRGTIQDGKVIFDTPPDWPNGSEVEVELVSTGEKIGISEEEQGDDPE